MLGQLISAVGFAIPSAAVLIIASAGFTLQFGMTNIFNLAYGAIMTGAALAAGTVFNATHSLPVSVTVAVITGMAVTLAVGQYLYRPFVRKGAKLFEMVMVSLAVGLIGQYGIAAIMHSNVEHYSLSTHPVIQQGNFILSNIDILAVIIAAVAMTVLIFFLRATNFGMALRATAVNAPLARVTGIRTHLVTNVTWLISGALCGLAGVLLSVQYLSLSSTTATDYLPIILVAVIVGGVGSIGGAALASALLALLLQITGVLGASAYETVVALGALVVVLLLRPNGVFSEMWDKKEITV